MADPSADTTMMGVPDPTDDRPAVTGQTRCEHLDGTLLERTVWPIGPPAVTERNVFLVITVHVDGHVTLQVAGNAHFLDASLD